MRAFLLAGRAGADAAYSQQGITTSSQQSLSQQGEAAKAAAEASAKASTVKSFFMSVLEVGKEVDDSGSETAVIVDDLVGGCAG